jgi:hypothetical protein
MNTTIQSIYRIDRNFVHTNICTYTYIYIYIYTCIYVHINICIYMYIYIKSRLYKTRWHGADI